MRRLSVLCAVALFSTGAALAQSVISARSGMVHYVEGQVLLDDKPVVAKFGQFPEMQDKQVLRTEQGRAEILLTPGVFLRIPENSSVRMISNRLTDTRIEVVSGSAMVECAEFLKDNAVTLNYKDWNVVLNKKGLYRVDTDPARLRVFDGEAQVVGNKQAVEVKKSKELFFGAVLSAEKFDPKQTDELYRWSSRRAEYLSMANVSAAKSLRDSGSSWGVSGWNFGMYTFVPYNGIYSSPFGFNFWSPMQVMNFYQPYYYGGGYGGGGYYNGRYTRGTSSNSSVNWSPRHDAIHNYNTASRATFAPPMQRGAPMGNSSVAAPASSGSVRGGMSSGGMSGSRGASGGGRR